MAPRDSRDTDDDAPWLAEASPRPQTRVSKRSFFWTLAVLLGLAAVAAIGLIVLMSKKDGGSTQGYMNAEQAPLIAAEPGPYKVAPLDPKGLEVEGQDRTMYAAGEGIEEGSVIDQSAMPEAPLPRPGTEVAPPVGVPATKAPGLPRNLVPEPGAAIPAAADRGAQGDRAAGHGRAKACHGHAETRRCCANARFHPDAAQVRGPRKEIRHRPARRLFERGQGQRRLGPTGGQAQPVGQARHRHRKRRQDAVPAARRQPRQRGNLCQDEGCRR